MFGPSGANYPSSRSGRGHLISGTNEVFAGVVLPRAGPPFQAVPAHFAPCNGVLWGPRFASRAWEEPAATEPERGGYTHGPVANKLNQCRAVAASRLRPTPVLPVSYWAIQPLAFS